MKLFLGTVSVQQREHRAAWLHVDSPIHTEERSFIGFTRKPTCRLLPNMLYEICMKYCEMPLRVGLLVKVVYNFFSHASRSCGYLFAYVYTNSHRSQGDLLFLYSFVILCVMTDDVVLILRYHGLTRTRSSF